MLLIYKISLFKKQKKQRYLGAPREVERQVTARLAGPGLQLNRDPTMRYS
jgi:hypothetical protein